LAIPVFVLRKGKKGRAKAHCTYICRLDFRKGKTEDLVYTFSANMPSWSKSPQDFWSQADTYERKNANAYREFMVALPRELSLKDQIALVKEFAKREFGEKHAYTIAIHVSKAIDGGDNPHAHIMFSERQNDGIERGPDLYFKRYNRENPAKGGAKKEFFGNDYMTREERAAIVKEHRNSFGDVCNAFLEKAQRKERVDMRSYKERGLDRLPEKHLLPSQVGGELHLQIAGARTLRKKIEEQIARVKELILRQRSVEHAHLR
jgi:hypothetical protein